MPEETEQHFRNVLHEAKPDEDYNRGAGKLHQGDLIFSISKSLASIPNPPPVQNPASSTH